MVSRTQTSGSATARSAAPGASRPSGSEPKQTFLATYAELFLPYRRRFLTAGKDGWYTKKRPLTDAVLESALRGTICLGIYPGEFPTWVAWDADDEVAAELLFRQLHRLPSASVMIVLVILL